MRKLGTLSSAVAVAVVVATGCGFDLYWYPGGSGGAGSASSAHASSGTGAPVCTPGATAPCYDGPAGTEGVGLCKAGIQTCAGDGTGWGACAGEVLPAPVDCASGVDKHCDGVPLVGCKGNTLWAARFGDASYQQGNGIATDAAGNVLVTGFVTGSVNFGGVNGALTSAGAADIFVAKIDPTGAPVWSKLLGDAADQTGQSIAADAMGNVLVTGLATGSITVGATTLTTAGGADIFVIKLDPTGGPVWSKMFGGVQDQQGASVATDTAGNVLLTGYVDGTVDFGGNVGKLTSAGAGDIFIAKLDPTGAPLWAKLFGDANQQEGTGIAADAAGNVLVTGRAFGTVDFGNGTLTSPGGDASFVASFDPGGALRWAKLFGDATGNGNSATGIATDAAGNVLVTGWVSGAVDFGKGTLTSAGGYDIFVAKFDSSGAALWSSLFGDAANQQGASVAVDPSSNVVVTGSFGGAVDFGSGTGQLFSAGPENIFVAKFKPDGTALWSRRFGDPTSQVGTGVATDSSSNVLMTGFMEGTVDFGIPPPLTSAGGADIFVARLAP